MAYLDCSLANAVRAGDHTIYVGEVEAAEVLRDDAAVLTYFRGGWGSMAGPSSG